MPINLRKTKLVNTLSRPTKILERLAHLPEPDFSKNWPDYEGFVNSTADIDDLLSVLELECNNGFDDDDEYCNTPIHAVRILTLCREVRAIKFLVTIVTCTLDDDALVLIDAARGLEKFGKTALPQIFEAITNDRIFGRDSFGYCVAIDVLEAIASADPTARKDIETFLGRMLSDAKFLPFDLNSSVVRSLISLKAKSFFKEIEMLIRQHFVDNDYLDWDLVAENIGLKRSDLTSDKPQNHIAKEPYAGDRRFGMLLRSVDSGSSVTDVRLLILGAIIAPRPKHFSEIKQMILTDFEGEPCEIRYTSQSIFLLAQILELWNEMNAYQDHLFVPDFSVGKDLDTDNPEKLANLVASASASAFRVASGFAAFLCGFLEDSEAPYTHPNPVLRSFIHDLRQQLEKFSKLISAKPGTKDMETFVMESKQLWFSRHNEFIKAAVQERRSIDIANDLVYRCQPEQGEKPQRNAPCPCGSGRKYKKCCYMNLS